MTSLSIKPGTKSLPDVRKTLVDSLCCPEIQDQTSSVGLSQMSQISENLPSSPVLISKISKTSAYWSSFCETKIPTGRRVYKFKDGEGTFVVIRKEIIEDEIVWNQETENRSKSFPRFSKDKPSSNVSSQPEDKNSTEGTETSLEKLQTPEVTEKEEAPACLVQVDLKVCGCTVPCRTLMSKLYKLQLEPQPQVEDPPHILVTSNRAMLMTGPSRILPWLYLGDKYHALDDDLLSRKKISLILNCTKDVPTYFPNQFRYHVLPLMDNIHEDVSIHFGDSFLQLGNWIVSKFMGDL
eukprot:TRINITY_DN1717_c0_g1_i2.p1 TRINITY_DN1717_c0_g1~~TRINITY_DN1717_c0_g1_i2.p1  ORF type:complete len:295 (-),score=60.35 TRINITY_DN1717_c0_g1_i2:709-1593(-)